MVLTVLFGAEKKQPGKVSKATVLTKKRLTKGTEEPVKMGTLKKITTIKEEKTKQRRYG